MIKDNLKKIREERGLTKRELCEKTGISERAYLTYEFGEREPKIGVIQKLADFYDVSIDRLLGRDEIRSDYIQRLADEQGLDSSQRSLLAAFCYSDEAGRDKLMKALMEVYEHKKKNDET